MRSFRAVCATISISICLYAAAMFCWAMVAKVSDLDNGSATGLGDASRHFERFMPSDTIAEALAVVACAALFAGVMNGSTVRRQRAPRSILGAVSFVFGTVSLLSAVTWSTQRHGAYWYGTSVYEPWNDIGHGTALASVLGLLLSIYVWRSIDRGRGIYGFTACAFSFLITFLLAETAYT